MNTKKAGGVTAHVINFAGHAKETALTLAAAAKQGAGFGKQKSGR